MKLFGPPLKESWHQLAASINADFDAGSFTKSPRVVLEYKHWVITLDTYTVSTGKSSVTWQKLRKR